MSLKIADDVNYLCSCGNYSSLPLLHFCRHCIALRCTKCLLHELDVVYCPTCLDSQSREESDLRENRCASCFACPNCGQFLSVRATLSVRQDQTDSEVAAATIADATGTAPSYSRVYYLTCNYCRWSSRDAGIRDQTTATGGWQEDPNPNISKIQQLCEVYNLLCLKEKLERERQGGTRKRSSFLHERLGFSSFTRRKSSIAPSVVNTGFGERAAPIQVPESEASEEVPPLDVERFLNQPLVLDNVAGISQRLLSPHRQPELVNDLYPRRRNLVANRSLRCRECEHNVSKHDRPAKSVKFKINCNALYHVPQIRLYKGPSRPWALNQTQQIVFTILNPATRLTSVSFTAIHGTPDEYSTAKLALPEGEFAIAARSDAADLIQDVTTSSNKDTSFVAFRQMNKLGLYFQCTPMVSVGKPVRVAFCMNFDTKHILHSTPSTLSASGRSLLASIKTGSPTPSDTSYDTFLHEVSKVSVKIQIQLGTVVENAI